MKLSACGTLLLGKERRRSYGAAYPRRTCNLMCLFIEPDLPGYLGRDVAKLGPLDFALGAA
jgi:hypothetical protein